VRGSITASCGHTLAGPEQTVSVVYGDEDCDAIDGFHRVVAYAEFCPRCAREWAERGDLFETEAEACAWLAGDPRRSPTY